eukprot:scaffold1220_cov376-Prasinococcus_capsulatus_cf.AAC.11
MDSMPVVGFGTARLLREVTTEAVKHAVRSGCRHIDCAKVYGNEEYVGTAIKQLIDEGTVKREELFVTSKLWNDCHHPSEVEKACRLSLSRLGLDYLDLYLIHWPVAWKKGTVGCPDRSLTLEQTWLAMERLQSECSIVKRIGVSNFDVTKLQRVLACESATVKPFANQVELHLLFQQPALVSFCKHHGVTPVAWSPLAKYSNKRLFKHHTLQIIAEKRQCTPVELALAWNLKRGVAIIPRSASAKHIESNARVPLEVASKLTEDDMRQLAMLDTGKRLIFDWVGIFDTSPAWTRVLGHVGNLLLLALWTLCPFRVDLRLNQGPPLKEHGAALLASRMRPTYGARTLPCYEFKWVSRGP